MCTCALSRGVSSCRNFSPLADKPAKAQIPLGSSRLDTTRHVRPIERVEPYCLTSSTQPKCMGSTRRTCRVVSRRYVTSETEFRLNRVSKSICRAYRPETSIIRYMLQYSVNKCIRLKLCLSRSGSLKLCGIEFQSDGSATEVL